LAARFGIIHLWPDTWADLAMKPKYFSSPAAWRAWLEKHHADTKELLVGFYKKDSGKPSITWPESVDEALCFGWIDGIRRSLDAVSYTIRFTPRKTGSTWSAINIQRVGELTKAGLMQPAGLRAFQQRQGERSEIYSYEQRKTATLSPAHQKQFRENKKAWGFFQAQAPWYRRTASWWVISAKKDETRQKRLAQLIDDSAHERPLKELDRRGSKK
jgi:uncharacterized protein YdeI (YjbR/CyaY-like superfamily)